MRLGFVFTGLPTDGGSDWLSFSVPDAIVQQSSPARSNMAKHGKGYLVTERTGEANIYRGGRLAGTFPESGFEVRVFGRCTALAGTELAAHALAEVHLDVEPHNRRWVLTEAEYEEHIHLLEDQRAAIRDAFPFTAEEEIAFTASQENYAEVDRQGMENIKRQLMNLSPYKYVLWDPNPRKRPDTFPALPEEAAASHAMR
jgi:hypothetical protein